jgi:DNA-directed RNA polymerase specialized sigma24 family protein
VPLTTRLPGVSAEQVVTAVRVHADRVHDAVRRLGCEPEPAVVVVEASARELVEVVARTPETVEDAVGWWFARALARGRQAARGGAREPLPLGGGLLSSDEDQVRLSEALDGLAEQDRVVVLLRDSYALPPGAVGAAVGTDGDAAMGAVGRARLAFLPLVDGAPAPPVPAHAPPMAALARLAEGGPVAARDATARRHAQSCTACQSLLDAQGRAHTLLQGLTVVALPAADREPLLVRVEQQARALLPAEQDLLEVVDDEEEWEPEPRLLSPLVAVLAVVLAVLLGVVLGVLLSRETRPAVRAHAVAPAAATALAPATGELTARGAAGDLEARGWRPVT